MRLFALLITCFAAHIAYAQGPPYAVDLLTPIGLEVDGQGRLWVTEVGTGNNDGRISVITPDGQIHTFVEGLGSIQEAGGVAGSYHLEFINEHLYLTNGLGTETADGFLLRMDTTGFVPGNGPIASAAIDTVANTGTFATANSLPENNLYDIEPGPNGDLFLADAGSNSVYRMDGQTGELELLVTLDPVPNPTPVGPPVIEAVPSKLLYDDGKLYVSMFSGFPFAEGVARIYEVTMDGEVSIFADGLTMITDLMVDPVEGGVLALQMGLFDPATGFVPETGSLVKIKETGLDSLVTGLLLPTGMHMAPDGDFFVSSLAGLIFKLPRNVSTSVDDVGMAVPEVFQLEQNYPNPFNPATTIRYTLTQPAHVTLSVFDAQGRLIERLADGAQSQGAHEVEWQAFGMASGVYFYALQSGSHIETRAMMLAK